jgi:hypothetical protein
MFLRPNQSDSLNGGTSHGWGWLLSDRASRRDRQRADAELINDLHWQWRSACQGTSLAQMIYTPSGPTKAIPMIGHIDLGPPVTFNVRMRPGQTIADFVNAAPLIAPTLNAAVLHVTPLVPQWLRVVLLSHPSAAA